MWFRNSSRSGGFEHRGLAMGGLLHLIVEGDVKVLRQAVADVKQLESKWSRFIPTSDIAKMNAATGRSVLVSRDTVTLVQRGCEAWRRTSGRFDPTVYDAIVALGYDRTFAEMPFRSAYGDPEPRVDDWHMAPGCGDIEIDPRTCSIRLPLGVRFDPGGFGKGLAADLVAKRAIERGAKAVLVNIGGDVRAIGRPSSGEWRVDVDSVMEPGSVIASLGLRDGAVATTSHTRRRWRIPQGEVHHLIDPMNGHPHWRNFNTLAVTADEAWQADVLVKALYLTPTEAWDDLLGAGGVALTVDDNDVVTWYGADRPSTMRINGIRPLHGHPTQGVAGRRTLAP